MKFVISNKTYDTATSTRAAILRGVRQSEGDQIRFEHVLYRTPLGNFFLHQHEMRKIGGRGKPVAFDTARELTAAEASRWCAEAGAVVLDSEGLELPGEA